MEKKVYLRRLWTVLAYNGTDEWKSRLKLLFVTKGFSCFLPSSRKAPQGQQITKEHMNDARQPLPTWIPITFWRRPEGRRWSRTYPGCLRRPEHRRDPYPLRRTSDPKRVSTLDARTRPAKVPCRNRRYNSSFIIPCVTRRGPFHGIYGRDPFVLIRCAAPQADAQDALC